MARSDVLVSADWAEQNLQAPKTVFIEVDEDTSAYEGATSKVRSGSTGARICRMRSAAIS